VTTGRIRIGTHIYWSLQNTTRGSALHIKITPWPLVRKRTRPTEPPPLVGEIWCQIFADRGVSRGQCGGTPTAVTYHCFLYMYIYIHTHTADVPLVLCFRNTPSVTHSTTRRTNLHSSSFRNSMYSLFLLIT
jgi:hypothetical protein